MTKLAHWFVNNHPLTAGLLSGFLIALTLAALGYWMLWG